jgi:hypothetical protein
MKTCSTITAVLLFAVSWITDANSVYAQAQAQAGNTQPQQTEVQSITLSSGSTVMVELSHSLNTHKLKPGDKVKAVLAQDLVARGRVVANTGSKLLGHVTEVKAHSTQDPESRLGIVFDKILLKHHKEIDFQGVVQAVAPPAPRRSRVDEPDQMMPPPMLGVGSISSSDPNRRGSSSSSSVGRGSTGSVLASSAATLGQVAVVASNPGSNPGDGMTTVRATASQNKVISGGVGMRGIYGLKNLELKPSPDKTNPAPVIVSTKSDVKLESGTQVVVLVVGK